MDTRPALIIGPLEPCSTSGDDVLARARVASVRGGTRVWLEGFATPLGSDHDGPEVARIVAGPDQPVILSRCSPRARQRRHVRFWLSSSVALVACLAYVLLAQPVRELARLAYGGVQVRARVVDVRARRRAVACGDPCLDLRVRCDGERACAGLRFELSGASNGAGRRLEPGDRVPVLVVPDDPSVAQLGTTPGFEPSPHLALLIAGTILAPLSFVLVWLLRRRARRWWEYPVGELTSVEPHAPGPGSDP